jgi:aminopeptidase N
MMNSTHTPTLLRDYTPPEFLIETVDLHFTLDPQATTVIARCTIRRNPQSRNNHAPLSLDGEQLTLLWVKLNDRLLIDTAYKKTDHQLILPSVPDQFTLEIKTKMNPQGNTALSGLYLSRNLFCTQCEAEGFRRITYFIDRPDILATYTTTIVANKKAYPVLLSNGNQVAAFDIDAHTHQVTWHDPFKKPSYLFALVAGDLASIEDTFVTKSGKPVLLQIFSESDQSAQCQHAMQSLKQAMRWDEEAYGREYDLATFMIVAIDDFNMGAMENKGLNIFNAQTILADPNVATDDDYHYITQVVGHEYFHNWTGNRITCRDWFQLSLKEGLTVFREQEFSETLGSPVVERIRTVNLLRTIQFAEDAGPLAHSVQPDSYIEINNFYTTTIYEKGAELIRMMKLLVGAKSFRQAMDHYFETYDGQAVTIEALINSVETVSMQNLSQFQHWYTQAGTPQLTAQYHYDPNQTSFELTLEQTCPPTPGQTEKQPLTIPIRFALLTKAGQSLPLYQEDAAHSSSEKECVLVLNQKKQHFRFLQVSEPVIPSLLRHFSAPVKLKIDYSDEILAFLIEKENDGFNRWEAAQHFLTRIVLKQANTQKKHDSKAVSLLLTAYQNLFASLAKQDPALLAELLRLPSVSYFADQQKQIDIDGIDHARHALRLQIAHTLQPLFYEFYQAAQTNVQPYQFTTALHAQRSLKNSVLSYLMLLNDPNIATLCLQQYQQADNLSDRLAALTALVHHQVPGYEDCLLSFLNSGRQQSLIICKWLAVQAGNPQPGALEQIRLLCQHPAFDWKNPNKVSALLGTFCTKNLVQFHQISGAGYVFLKEQILRLDALNPQLAARFVKPFTRWRRFDETRRKLMQQQLEALLHTTGLSADVYELVSKTLISQ